MKNKILNICYSFFLFGLFLVSPISPAHAIVMLQGDTGVVAVAPEVLYFEDQTGSQSFFQAQSQFKRFEREAAPHDSTQIHLTRDGSIYWLKLSINNATNQQNWVLHLQPVQDISAKPVWLDEILVFQNDMVGKPIYTTHNNYIPLALSSQKQNDYLIMIKTINGLEATFKPLLETEQHFASYQRDETTKMTMSWIVISIFATASLIFFILSRMNAFLFFAIYSVILVQGSIMASDFGKNLYGILLNFLSPIQILPFMAGFICLSAVVLTIFSFKDKAVPFLLKLTLFVIVAF